jgi:SAM-dependent methyltransferase
MKNTLPGLEPRTACPACGSVESKTIFECPYADPDLKSFLISYYAKYDPSLLENAVYRLDQCPNCNLVFQAFVPDYQLLEVVYDQWIGVNNGANKAPFQPSMKGRDAHEILAILKYFRLSPSDLSVLDYGMGLAKWCQTAQMLGCNVSGFDLAESRMENARGLGIHVVQWDEMPEQQVHFINTEQVFEHLVNPFEVIEQLTKALIPGGVLKISVPFANRIHDRLKKRDWMAKKYTHRSLNPVLPLEHVNCWCFESVKKLASRVGLKPANRSLMCDLAFLGQPSSIDWAPRELARSLLRPAYKRWYPHKLYCWLAKPK